MGDATQKKETTTLRNADGYMVNDTHRRERDLHCSRYLYPEGLHMNLGDVDVVPEVPVRRVTNEYNPMVVLKDWTLNKSRAIKY
ncbi:hypothetical protein TNCV_4464051 [Trichonephila clavipes]|nr:hypothetical protein TNCV_4464051 [Trichonephila clavipes]